MSLFSRRNTATVAGLLIALAVLGVIAIPGEAATCNDSWMNPSGGAWNVAGNWSAGVPTSSSDVCLPALASSYVVTLTSGVSVHSVDIGASSGATTQTLDIEGT